MKLEGTLDAFSLADILALLSSTRKTGALHVTQSAGRHGAVHLRDGQVTGARTQVAREELGRRLLGSGLVEEQALDRALERLAYEQGAGLGRVLADTASVDSAAVRELAAEQAVDAVFDLLRWTEGAFAFDTDEQDPDDVGAALPVEQVLAEARLRLEAWPGLTAAVPSHEAVVVIAPVPPGHPQVDAEHWWLLALVDGRRTVADLVSLSGRGEYAVVRAVVALLQRDLLLVRTPGDPALTALQRRQAVLAGLEQTAPVAAPVAPAAAPAPPLRSSVALGGGRASDLAVPERTPYSPPAPRLPDVAPALGTALASAPAVEGEGHRGGHGSVHGATALQPDVDVLPGVRPAEGVDTTLLLRLIDGVRGL